MSTPSSATAPGSSSTAIVVGVLALQGDFAEHIEILGRLGVKALAVRYAEELDGVDALIIPGGESTAVAKLTDEGTAPIFAAIKERIAPQDASIKPMPCYGTCMGSIFLAREIEGSSQGRLAVMDVKVRRNAFGPQRKSFESDLAVPVLGSEPFPAVFIRAPVVLESGPEVEILAELENYSDTDEKAIVMARQGHLLITAFHPEITDDVRVHQYFLSMVSAK